MDSACSGGSSKRLNEVHTQTLGDKPIGKLASWQCLCGLAHHHSLRPLPAQVAELQQQLRVLQAVGFGAVEGDSAPGVGPLEVQLLGKLRALEHQLTMARLQEAESAGEALPL